MIKLINIINEIKLVPLNNITINNIFDLDKEIWSQDFPSKASDEAYNLYTDKYDWRSNKAFDSWLYDQDKNTLKQIYIDLLKIKQKYKPLKEIKITKFPKDINAKKVIELYQSIIISNEYNSEIEDKIDKEVLKKYISKEALFNSFQKIWKYIEENLDQNELTNLYIDLNNFITRYKIHPRDFHDDTFTEIQLTPGIPNNITPDKVRELVGRIRGEILLINNNVRIHDDFLYKLDGEILQQKYFLNTNYKRLESDLKFKNRQELQSLYKDLYQLYLEVKNYVSKQPK